MNRERKKLVDNAITMIEEIRDDENDSYDAMGPGLQASPAGIRTEDNIAYLEAAISELQSIE